MWKFHLFVMAMLLSSFSRVEAKAAPSKRVQSPENQTQLAGQPPSNDSMAEKLQKQKSHIFDFSLFRSQFLRRFSNGAEKGGHKIRHEAHWLRKLKRTHRSKRHINTEPIPALQNVDTSGLFPDEIPDSRSIWLKWPRHKQ